MRCRASIQRERDRLERALEHLRDEVKAMGEHPSTSSNLAMMIDEAYLKGQIQAIDTMLAPEPGGWPHDAWSGFQDARKDAVLSLVKAGKSFDEVLETLNLTEIQARLLVKLEEPDDKN